MIEPLSCHCGMHAEKQVMLQCAIVYFNLFISGSRYHFTVSFYKTWTWICNANCTDMFSLLFRF